MDIPVDIITFEPLPDYLTTSIAHNSSLGYNILPLTPDKFQIWKGKGDVPKNKKFIRKGTAPFKHLRDITIPKLMELRDKHNGFFIIEGDVLISQHFTPQYFKDNFDISKPYWLGYKKRLSDYVVGNFLLYFPSSFIETLQTEINNKVRIMYSDRFLTQLVWKGLIEVIPKSVAIEMPHISGTTGKYRK